MALSLEIQKVFTEISERVKSVDLHPIEPWILTSLYSGTVCILNYQSQAIVKTFKVTDSPVRSAKFVARKNWVVAASDDKFIRVYNYDTMEKVAEFEAHTDFIRFVVVHPTLPYLLSSSDDKLIKVWDWEKGWICTKVFEEHQHYVMQVAFNPVEVNTFASASLDGTIKVWNLESPAPIFTLEGHSKGVNSVDYFINGDKLYLLSGSDDYTVKVCNPACNSAFLIRMCVSNVLIRPLTNPVYTQNRQVWDYETRSCVQTLEGHEHNVTAVCVHPEFPIIITCSEDQTIRLWNANTYGLESKLNYGLERVWAVGCIRGSNQAVFGCDKGTIMVKVNSSSGLDIGDLQTKEEE
ncbi:hypothetical protein HS088_TW10G00699 [Tripterygium wilfordii]|uniref:Beta'-coat protein n=1 Tax=Tripterygium wilfordii TaxID=458696 RepID=A0A7J7D5Q3_TRIWF|nr:hypothetical protein HS088_TW10G00699 [Tripterygium wilfordii]